MNEWLKPRIRLIGTGFLGKLKCNCRGVKEVFCGSEEKIIAANTCNNNETFKTRSSGDGPRFPQLLFMIKLLGAFGTRQDLKNLKQVSQLYYELINPIYLDIVESVLSIGRKHGSRLFDLHQIWMSGTKRKQSFNCGIPPCIWNTESAYIFRKIIAPQNLLWYDQPDLKYDGIHLTSIISQIRPYITILHLPRLPTLDPNLLNFINQFPELKQLNIDFLNNYIPPETEMIDDSEGLKMLFQKLKKKTLHVKLRVGCNYWPMLEAFGNINGMTIEIYIHDGSNRVRTFTSLSDNSGKWRNIKFISLDFRLSVNSLSSELMQITSRYVKHKDQIQDCHIYINEFPPNHNPSEESTIQKCLVKLSPILSLLHLMKVNCWNVFCLNSGTIWQNLEYLCIYELECPLEFLKGSSTSSSFPSLVKLILYIIDQDVCIFHDSQKSHEEALMTYFGNLPKLKYLCLHCKDGTIDRLSAKPELISSLKDLVPELEVDSFHSSSGSSVPFDQRSIHSY